MSMGEMPIEEKDVCLGGSAADLATCSTLLDTAEGSVDEDEATGGILKMAIRWRCSPLQGVLRR